MRRASASGPPSLLHVLALRGRKREISPATLISSNFVHDAIPPWWQKEERRRSSEEQLFPSSIFNAVSSVAGLCFANVTVGGIIWLAVVLAVVLL